MTACSSAGRGSAAVGFATVLIAAFLDAKGAFAADVEITANAPSVNLDAFTGTTAHINGGVAIGSSSPAIGATLQAWSVTNNGSVSGGNTVTLGQGGAFLNASGATVTGTLTAMTFGYKPFGLPPAGGPGHLDNYGTITGGAGEGVTMWFGGTVNNFGGGTIKTDTGLNAVSIGQGTSRVLFNAGSIQATKTSGFSTGVLMQGGPSVFTNAVGGVIFGDYNGVYASASAVFASFGNAGSISSRRGPAVEATGGGTIVNTGAIGSTNAEGILIRNNSNADITNSGSISGAVNAISFAAGGGAATAAVHTLRLQTGSTLNGNVLGGANTDNLILEGSGAESIAKFQNFETLAMNGADWTLTGAGAFSRGVTLTSGVTRVGGRLTSPAIEVRSGATLTGAGVVAGAVANFGNVRIDSGKFTIEGNYVQQAGSALTVGVTPSAAGALSVAGTATIDGGAVRALAAQGDYAANASYTILTAAGGRSGVFDEATTDLAFYSPSLSYDANNVYLKLVRNSVDFSNVGGTRNQIAAGRALELAGLAHPIVAPALLLTAAEARAAFDGLSGEIHSSLRALLVDESRMLRDAVLERQRQAVSGSTVPVFAVWAHGFGDWARLGGDGNAATARMSTAGGLAGVDMALGDSRLGVAAGGGHSEARVDSRASTGDMESAHVAVYGDTHAADLGLRVGGAYSHHDVTTMRRIAFRGFADAPHADYGAHTAQAFGEASYRGLFRGFWPFEGAEAFVGVAHVRVASDGFRESGGPAALTVAGAQTATTFSSIGVRAQTSAWTIGTAAVSARASFAWSHAFDRIVPTTGMSLAPGSAPVFVAGAPLAVDALLIEAGLDAAVAPNALASLVYSSRLASGAEAHALKGRFLWQF
ncbi:autotransporter domain-containing protein [Methylosinus sp. RM1]|uniref:autotransporter outer membrane beta-barrel domain-containing protein n=1 Tax=Methylosinus sp. RM1 TaxID=2583817 RepID=UPI00140BDF3C|nr:autotransporter domain-containing protein [Methylosinus sp. RM1]